MTRALITGATSGLGLEFAWQLAGSGHDVILQGRHEDRLVAVAAQIEAVAGARVETLTADLANRRDVEAVVRRLLDPVEPVSLLVNVAGHTSRSAFLEADVEEHAEHLDVVVRATMMLCHAAARAMVNRGAGGIINVSSMAGLSTTSLSGAEKCWTTIFTEALAAELKGTGVSAMVLLPGFVHTDTHKGAAMNVDGVPRVNWVKAPFVVEQALKDCAAGEVISVPSLSAGLGRVGSTTPAAVRRALYSDRVAKVSSKIRTKRAERAAKRHTFRFPWCGSD